MDVYGAEWIKLYKIMSLYGTKSCGKHDVKQRENWFKNVVKAFTFSRNTSVDAFFCCLKNEKGFVWKGEAMIVKSPPDLERYLEGWDHKYVSYKDGAKLYGLPYWT